MEQRTLKYGEWYWVDKAIIQKYARKVGFLAIVVYDFLASMADESQTCYPSQGYIAQSLGCSRRSVSRAIKSLVGELLISVWKTSGKRAAFTLLQVKSDTHGTDLRHGRPEDGTKGSINNNKEQERENNKFVGDLKTHDPIKEPHNGIEIQSKQELLAHDLAEGLNDTNHYSIYISYAKEYPEPFLRRVLAETKMTPDSKIRKSRAALFNYLLHHYARKGY